MHRARNISLVLGFLAVLLAPALASVLHLNPMGAIDEKRALARKPQESPFSRMGLRHVPAIAQAWEKYFNDHFGLRKLLIGSYRLAIFHVLRTSPNPAVVVGASGEGSRWLYYDASVNGDGVGLDSVLGKKPYTSADLAEIANRLKAVTSIVRGKGAKLVIIVCPDKQTIYPEYLPRTKRVPPGAISRLDQFWAMAATLDDVPLVDPRKSLRRAKRERVIYYPSDTHWNMFGEIVGFETVSRALALQDPSRGTLAVERLKWVLGQRRVGDLTNLMGLPLASGDEDWIPVMESILPLAGPKRGKLLVVADSFFASLQPFFALQFESVKWIPHLNCAKRVGVVDPAWLDKERPDVVILESVERWWTMD